MTVAQCKAARRKNALRYQNGGQRSIAEAIERERQRQERQDMLRMSKKKKS